MTPKYQVLEGDCREVVKTLKSDSVDSIVTDPPYELGFMGKGWDKSGIAYDVSVWRECLRVLKPGGHLLAFGGSRTYHRLACAIEDAGFEIRDQIQWIYGSGFPKSLDVSKHLDLMVKNEWENIKQLFDQLDHEVIIEAWSRALPSAALVDNPFLKSLVGVGFNTQRSDSVPANAPLPINPKRLPFNAIIAELKYFEALRSSGVSTASAHATADISTEPSQVPAVSVGRLLQNPSLKVFITVSIARCGVKVSLNGKTANSPKDEEALKTWLGKKQYLEARDIDALCAGLIDGLKLTILNQSETFQNLDTQSQTECVSAMTVITTESTAASLISFTVDTLKSIAIDAAARAEREVVSIEQRTSGSGTYDKRPSRPNGLYASEEFARTLPATSAAQRWNGWGTALKPAHEILTLAYKPHEYDAERDKIDVNLLLLEARLWSLLPARIAAEHFQLSQAEQGAALDSAQWNADERNSIRAALLDPMGTSRCVSVMSTCLNTVRSWRSILDALCEITSTSTIETKTSLITDLRILNYSLSQTTPSIIIKAASQADGQALNALPVAQHFAAARLKLNGILTLSALDAATSKAHTLHRAGIETEGIVLARKPLIGTVAQNVLEHGTGGLNINGCRIETNGEDLGDPSRFLASDARLHDGWQRPHKGDSDLMSARADSRFERTESLGRWPANVIHDGSDEVLAGFPETTVGTFNGHRNEPKTKNAFGEFALRDESGHFSSTGSAARFFYCAKASKLDREDGLISLPLRSAGDVTDRKDGSAGLDSPRAGAGRTNGSRNNHPTVKPASLMAYLCRLITPPKGTILDPFCGSGSTGRGAMIEKFNFIGIELSPEYCEMARLRIEAAIEIQGDLFDFIENT